MSSPPSKSRDLALPLDPYFVGVPRLALTWAQYLIFGWLVVRGDFLTAIRRFPYIIEFYFVLEIGWIE